MTQLGHSYGVDVSAHQRWFKPEHYQAIAQSCTFVYVRAQYGTRPDSYVLRHVEAFRKAGAYRIGLYHFFRPDLPAERQFNEFQKTAKLCGYNVNGIDIVPMIDIEEDPIYGRPNPAWNARAEGLTQLLVDSYGDCLVYITNDHYEGLTSPAWVTQRPMWVPRYNTTETPPVKVGGKDYLVWQHRVAPFEWNGGADYQPKNPLAVDQNRCYGVIPEIFKKGTEP